MKKYLILILTTICACLVIPCLWQKTVSVHAASVSSQQSLTNAVNSLADKNDL